MNKETAYILLCWLTFISLVTAAVTVTDKLKAKRGSFRVSEKALIVLALLGGSVAEYFTMRLIRHKTLHKKFMIGLPFIIIFQLITAILVFFKLYST